MRNRDYYVKPIQSGGRHSSSYGHTKLHVDRPRSKDRIWWMLIIAVVGFFIARVLL